VVVVVVVPHLLYKLQCLLTVQPCSHPPPPRGLQQQPLQPSYTGIVGGAEKEGLGSLYWEGGGGLGAGVGPGAGNTIPPRVPSNRFGGAPGDVPGGGRGDVGIGGLGLGGLGLGSGNQQAGADVGGLDGYTSQPQAYRAATGRPYGAAAGDAYGFSQPHAAGAATGRPFGAAAGEAYGLGLTGSDSPLALQQRQQQQQMTVDSPTHYGLASEMSSPAAPPYGMLSVQPVCCVSHRVWMLAWPATICAEIPKDLCEKAGDELSFGRFTILQVHACLVCGVCVVCEGGRAAL